MERRRGNSSPEPLWRADRVEQATLEIGPLGELKNAGKTYRGPQPALIAPELFDAVQAMQPVKRRAKSKMERPYPLVDVLHCGHCGTRLSTHYVDRGDWKIPYYRCTQTFKKTWTACPVKQVNADKMEKQVLRVLDHSPVARA